MHGCAALNLWALSRDSVKVIGASGMLNPILGEAFFGRDAVQKNGVGALQRPLRTVVSYTTLVEAWTHMASLQLLACSVGRAGAT